MSAQGFEAALRRLVTDEEFADAVAQDADVLGSVYVITDAEKDVLSSIFQTINPGATGAGVIIACYAKCN